MKPRASGHAPLDAAPRRTETGPMPASPQDEARKAIDAAGQLPDQEIDIAATALQFARIDAPEADWRRAAETLTGIARLAGPRRRDMVVSRSAGRCGCLFIET